MKKCFLVFILIFVSLKIFATPLIDAAKNQDYKTFERLVNDGVSLDEINESGMNVQLSLAYFNDKDFEKACELLSSKGFNFDVPVDATQFSTFKFYSEIDGQQIVTLRQDKMKELFDSLNFDVEINNYYETDKILEQLIKTEQSEDLYVLIVMTGKNPIAPFQWVNISGGDYSKNSETANLIVANPNGLYQFVDFQVKDLTELITIKIKNAD